MSRIILAGKNALTQMLQQGLCKTVPEQNRHLVHGHIMLQDLVPLTWKFEAALQNGNCEHTGSIAAELMCIPNYKRLDAKQQARWANSATHCLSAQPGDVIVVLPFNPKDIPPGPDDDPEPFEFEFVIFEANHNYFGSDYGSGRSSHRTFTTHSFTRPMERHRGETTVRRYLEQNKVQVIYVGSYLPADIAHVYRDVDWKRLSVDAPNDLKAMLERYPNMTVSVFDMVRGSTSGLNDVQFWHGLHFRGRSEVTFGELATMVKPAMTSPFIEQIATAKLKSMGLTPVSYKQQNAVLKETFKLPYF